MLSSDPGGDNAAYEAKLQRWPHLHNIYHSDITFEKKNYLAVSAVLTILFSDLGDCDSYPPSA